MCDVCCSPFCLWAEGALRCSFCSTNASSLFLMEEGDIVMSCFVGLLFAACGIG